MNRRRSLFIVAATLVAATLGLLYWRGIGPAPQPISHSPPVNLQRSEPASDAPRAPTGIETPIPMVSGSAHEERIEFHARTRKFFAEAAALSDAERTTQARALAGDVDRYEGRGELSASEALLLKIALIRESVTDPTQRAAQIAEVEKSYREETTRRQAAWAAQRDPMFELYKLREAAIAENVMAMNEIPDGLSRSEYLRQRLQAERELLLDTTP